MKKRMIFPAIFALFLMLCLNFRTAVAAGTATVYLHAEKSSSGIVTLTCNAEQVGKLTNGKIRIRYDGEKMKLERSELGSVLKNFMCQINDPIQGTKNEGEILLVFASADEREANGNLLTMRFSLKEAALLKDLKFSVNVEEMKCGSTRVSPAIAETKYEPEIVEPEKNDIGAAEAQTILDQVYTGKQIRPSVKLRYKGAVLREGKHYTLSYSKNRKIGTAVITVRGLGNYTGTKKLTFQIVPAAPKLKSVSSPAKKRLSVIWTRVKPADGYQIQIAENRFFTKNVRNVTVKKNKNISKLLKRKSKKRYFVRVRTYKTVRGKKYYSAYSNVKRRKVK